MATLQTVIDQGMALISQVEPGVSATVTESADALIAINHMLDSWRNEKLMCYALQDESITLASGNTTKTIGPTGDLVSTRPVSIDAAYILYNSTSIPVRIIEANEYLSISIKTATATFPDRIYYKPEMPNGRIYLYPLPNAASELHILTWTPVTAFAAVSTTVTLPPGWELALATNLAINLAPKYQATPSKQLEVMARDSKANIKRINARPLKTYTELGALLGQGRPNILTNGL